MSRVGKSPVAIPSGVTVNLTGNLLSVKGKLGELKLSTSDEVETTVQDDKVWVKPKSETRRSRSHWGTTRALVNNMVRGVSEGYKRTLEINGVGMKAQAQGKRLNLSLGFSHDINFDVPEGIEIKTPSQTQIEISGIDRQKVGQVAANIRAFKRPEPYKGKGIKYAEETIRRKEGKKK